MVWLGGLGTLLALSLMLGWLSAQARRVSQIAEGQGPKLAQVTEEDEGDAS